MSITQNLVNMMRGEIFVKSTVNLGSVFTVRIPQHKTGSDILGKELAENLQQFQIQSVKQITKSQIIVEPMPYGKILIVDDVESNLYVAKGLMKPYELNIETVMSGYDAIAKIKTGNVYDIVFMDHMMPKMDGVEATKIIRDLGYRNPIIALTANAVVGQAEIFLANGFDGFVSKPIDMRELNSVLKEFVRDKQPPEVLEAARLRREPGFGIKVAPMNVSIDPDLTEIFWRDASNALSTLRTIHENREAYTDGDIRLYTITVHGLKTSPANVGEHGLSAAALSLEKAARNSDAALMASETQPFLDDIAALIDKLTPDESRTVNTTDDDLPYLRENLLAVQDACAIYDKKAAKDIITELRQKEWPAAINDTLKKIAEYLLHSDFDEAADAAGEIVTPAGRQDP
jgi:CheY-like chemotaxis protein/HPt (histidine-containing phosphotransfer) domain-containing protein